MRGALTVLLRNGLFFADGHFWENLCVRLETGRVTAMGEGLAPLAGEAVIDLQGDFVLPGFVDAHIHAFRGHDTMQGEDAIRQMARELYREGVAAFLPTTMSASVEDTRRVIAAVRRVMDTPEQRAARVLGVHMEAPFLSPEKAGAQRKEFFLHPSWEAFLELTGGDIQAVRVITMAPELPGAEAFIRKAAENGIHVSIGHTAATDEQVHQAADWGASRVTHTYNAQTPFTHRAPGVPGAALTDDRLFAEFIGDGVHLHDDAVKVLLRCKGADKAVAITDSMEAAGLPDGEYALGGQAVTVRGHEARLHDGTLAGSVLLMWLGEQIDVKGIGRRSRTCCCATGRHRKRLCAFARRIPRVRLARQGSGRFALEQARPLQGGGRISLGRESLGKGTFGFWHTCLSFSG